MRQTVLVFISVMLSLGVFAQNRSVEETKDLSVVDTIHESYVDSLQQLNDTLRIQLETLESKIKSLEEEIRSNEDVVKNCRQYKDKVKELEHKLLFADTVIARISNNCLLVKFDSIRVEQAISDFKKMYSPSLQKRWSKLVDLLNNYGEYTRELDAVLREIQEDAIADKPHFGCVEKYIEKIKQTQYYKNIYKADWTIPYLNDVIDKSIKAINEYNPRKPELHLPDLTN